MDQHTSFWLVFIASASSESSDEPAHTRSPVRAVAYLIKSMEVDEGSDQTLEV